MAYSVSEQFRNQLYSGESTFRAILTIGENTIDNDQIASISISSPIIDDSKQVFYVGSFISQKITIKFKNMDGIEVKSGDAVDLKIGQYVYTEIEDEETGEIEVQGDWYDVPIGKYLVDDLAENYYEKCEITCLDYGIKFKPNIDYSPCFVNGKATVATILRYICDYFNVSLGDYPTINDNVEVGTYDSTVSGKQWISYIAELKGCNAKIDRSGNLVLQPIKQGSNVPINALESASWELGEKYEITKVTYFDAIRNFSYGTDEGNTLIIRQDNPFITDTSVVENIYDAVEGLVIWSLKTHNFGDFTLDAWDLIEYSLGEDTYTTINNNTITYEMSIMSDVNVKIPNKTQEVTTNVVGGDESVNIKKIKTEVDQINATATILAEQTSNNTTQISQLQASVEGIQNLFTLQGGINIIRNSAFLLGDAVWGFVDNGNNPYHTPLGASYNVAMAGITSSVSEIKLQDVIVRSIADNITGLKTDGTIYTLNFSYKQDTDTITTIRMYDVNDNTNKAFDDIVITGVKDFQNYVVSFRPHSTNYIFEIETRTSVNSGAFYLYDLMLNIGEKQSWSPAPDEIYSTTLTMSRLGLKVYSIGDGTITLLGSDGLITYETTDGVTLGRIISLRTADGDKTRQTTTQSNILTSDIMNEHAQKWHDTIVTMRGRLHKITYLETGE